MRHGGLGAGKTVFARSGEELGSRRKIVSPSSPSPRHIGSLTLYHRSLPPFEEREAEGIGLEEVLYGKGMRGGMGGKNQLHVAKMLYKHRFSILDEAGGP